MLAKTRRFTLLYLGAIALAMAGFEADARAHIDLLSPAPREHGPSREPNSNVKQGPCGQEVNGRTDRVTVLEPGATVAVTWVETTNHRSYYRIAFDADGDAAFPTFVGTGRGAEGIDPSIPCPVDGKVILAYDMDDRAGGSHTLAVRLPDVECERCTLQVVQFMYDTARPYYFQCADVTLRRSRSDEAAALDAGSNDAAPPVLPSDASSAVASSPRAAPGCSSSIAPSDPGRPTANPDSEQDVDDPARATEDDPPAAAGGSPATPPTPSRSEDGGCSFEPAERRSNALRGLPLIVAFVVSRARRRAGRGGVWSCR